MCPLSVRNQRARVAWALALSAAVPAPGAAAAPIARNSPTAYTLALPQLAASAAGRQLLDYVVSCALPAGVELESAGYRFGGALGLAPGWLHAAPDEREQRAISACLLARTNLHGRRVEISLRSAAAGPRAGAAEPRAVAVDPRAVAAEPPAGLRADASERVRFARREGSFFGNLFASPAVAYACAGDSREDRTEWLEALGRACSLPVPETVGGAVSARIGSPTLCGFTYVGVCDARTYVQAGIDYSETAIDVHLPFVPSRGADDSSGARVLHATRRSDNR